MSGGSVVLVIRKWNRCGAAIVNDVSIIMLLIAHSSFPFHLLKFSLERSGHQVTVTIRESACSMTLWNNARFMMLLKQGPERTIWMGSLGRKRMNFNILYFFISKTKYWMTHNLNDMSSVLLLSVIEFTQLVILTLCLCSPVDESRGKRRPSSWINLSYIHQRQMVLA